MQARDPKNIVLLFTKLLFLNGFSTYFHDKYAKTKDKKNKIILSIVSLLPVILANAKSG
tara:strand:+ start:1462 stop:1638 length:177 start_codon:yes stop_codon:yes gene_type:complete